MALRIILALIILLLLIGIVWFIAAQTGSPNEESQEGDDLQGLITQIDRDSKTFVLTQAFLSGNGEGYGLRERETSILWTDETIFYAYADQEAVENHRPQRADENALQPGKNAVVETIETEGDSRTAFQIYILPQSQ